METIKLNFDDILNLEFLHDNNDVIKDNDNCLI